MVEWKHGMPAVQNDGCRILLMHIQQRTQQKQPATKGISTEIWSHQRRKSIVLFITFIWKPS